MLSQNLPKKSPMLFMMWYMVLRSATLFFLELSKMYTMFVKKIFALCKVGYLQVECVCSSLLGGLLHISAVFLCTIRLACLLSFYLI